jgi:predicted extracellular nuclease
MKKSLFKTFSVITILALMLMALPMQSAGAAGTVSLTTLGSAYTEDFNTLASSGTANTTVPNGWEFSESGANANTTYRAGTGSDNTGDTYSFGATSNTERAFGGLRSGTLVPLIGGQFTNNTGATITSLDIVYMGEQWRLGQNTTGRAADRLDFQLSSSATSITTGTWTDYDSLDFSSPVVAGTVGALNGNVSPNRTAISFSITGLSIANGASFWLRWADTDLIPGADDGLSVDDFSLTPNGVVPPINLSVSDVSANEGNSGTTSFDFTVSLASPAGAGGVTFDIATADDTAAAPSDYTAKSLTGQTIPGGSSTYTFSVLVNGDTGVEPDETFSVNVTNVTGATVVDGQGQGTIVNDDTNFCALSYTPIYQIQGSGLSAAMTGNVTTQGVVVGDFEGTASASGFYLQDLTGDGNAATSDGIFVFTGASNLVNVGDVVRVTGFARERFNQTTLNGSNSNTAAVPAANIINCGAGSVPATDVTLPFANADFPERYEGMLVRFPQALVIAEYFNYDRFGEIVLAQPLSGETRPFTGTAIDEPGAAANARTLANSLSRITLDDANSAQNPSTLRHPNGAPFSLANKFRGGDTVQNAVGVLGFDFSLYRIFPTGPADYTSVNPRPASPEEVGGTLRVAAMNTLNFFVTANYPTGNSLDNKCGPANNLECRGWDSDQSTEFTRQRDKLLTALSGLNGDIIGLNELENSTGVEPLDSIVSGLSGYDYIHTGTIGTDAIKVGLIYRPLVVTPVGTFKLLTTAVDPRFIDTKSRPSLAQTFEVNATGARFTVVVNHFKSKGSACDDIGDPDLGDGQGNCSQTRKAAAQALVDWIATDPTGSGDPDFLIVGDLNSYAMEESIDAIKAGPDDTVGTSDDYTNLISHFHGAYAYSYTFDGQAGYLDHALANASIFAQITGAADWHINSDEPDVLDYDTSFKPAAQDALYEINPYRTSDHDPVVVGLDPINFPPTAEAGGPYSVVEGGSVTLNATGVDPEGTAVTFDWDLDNDGTFETPGQSVTFSAASITAPVTLTVKVKVTDAFGNFAVDETTVSVLYNFTGFFQPVDNLPTVNTVKAGQGVPVKFSLNGDHGLDIFAAGYPKIEFTSCTSNTTDAIETTVTAGSSSLSYDAATDQYTYTWKTDKAWANKCGTLQITFNDGTTQSALFKFTK